MRALWKNMSLALVQNTLRIQGSLMPQRHKQLISSLCFGLYYFERHLLSGTESELQPEGCERAWVLLQPLRQNEHGGRRRCPFFQSGCNFILFQILHQAKVKGNVSDHKEIPVFGV